MWFLDLGKPCQQLAHGSGLASFICLYMFLLVAVLHQLKFAQLKTTYKIVCVANQWFEDLVGNGMQYNVVCGNSTANICGDVIIPLLTWLFLDWLFEQPVP